MKVRMIIMNVKCVRKESNLESNQSFDILLIRDFLFFPFQRYLLPLLFSCCVVGWDGVFTMLRYSTVLLLITNCLDNKSTVQYSTFITYHINYVDERHDEWLYIYIYSGTVLVGLAEGSSANYLNVCCVWVWESYCAVVYCVLVL